ncbi:hypothetical protein [Streptomyces sp. NPDC056061]|uniref:hypothetical protein n=1 Tax=Streptomyces sp. NPDC056061 TaxID=3345700 RepID=UPI0035D7C568
MGDTTLVARFLRGGFVKSEGAVAPRVAADCARLLWRETGPRPGRPVDMDAARALGGRHGGRDRSPPHPTPRPRSTRTTCSSAGRREPRCSLGTFPLRFPHEEEPDDAGLHIEGSCLPEGESW